MPTPTETKIAAVLRDHKQHISANHKQQMDILARLAVIEAKPASTLPWRWTLSAWLVLGTAAVIVVTLFALLLGARSDLHALQARMDSRRMATEADIQAILDAKPAAEVAAAPAPVKRRKREVYADNDPLGIRPIAGAAANPSAVPAAVPTSSVPAGGVNP